MRKKVDYTEKPNQVQCAIRDNVAREIKKLLKEHNIKQDKLAEYLYRNGCTIDPSHLSQKLKLVSSMEGKSLRDIWTIYNHRFTAIEISLIKKYIFDLENHQSADCKSSIMDFIPKAPVDIDTPINAMVASSQKILQLDIDGERQLISDTKNSLFKGYLGEYFCYFHSTVKHKHELIKATLNLSGNAEDNTCDATMEIALKDPKIYKGKFLILDKLKICYCLLHGKSTGELCLLVWEYFGINGETQRLEYRIAEVVTVSAGGGNRPAAHRMLISYKKLSQKELELIAPQLKLNKRTLLIKESALECFCRTYPQFQWAIDIIKKNATKEMYYHFPESAITDQREFSYQGRDISIEEAAMCVCLLRKYTNAPENNKVAKSTDEIVRVVLDNPISVYGQTEQEPTEEIAIDMDKKTEE